ncbi:MAG: hypothetical protein KGZ52_02685 [Xanthomonadaceae bacterium]|nr:hypothetical protein [Xanthomonadaceae bacterium]
MGRFLSGGDGSVPRALRTFLAASNPSIAIPSWARMIRIDGCGGGGGGATRNSSWACGGGGAGFVRGLLLALPTGVTTAAATIGAGGTCPLNSGAAPDQTGTNGGNTVLTIGSLTLTIPGGGGATPTVAGARGGMPFFGTIPFDNLLIIQGVYNENPAIGTGPGIFAQSPMGFGITGEGSTGSVGGGGGHGPFGVGGARGLANPGANASGQNAVGYGAGGSGGYWFSSGGPGPSQIKGGDGSLGFLSLEFLEGI